MLVAEGDAGRVRAAARSSSSRATCRRSARYAQAQLEQAQAALDKLKKGARPEEIAAGEGARGAGRRRVRRDAPRQPRRGGRRREGARRAGAGRGRQGQARRRSRAPAARDAGDRAGRGRRRRHRAAHGDAPSATRRQKVLDELARRRARRGQGAGGGARGRGAMRRRSSSRRARASRTARRARRRSTRRRRASSSSTSTIGELVIRAPAAARVEALDLRPGDILQPNAPAATLLEDGQLYVRIYVPETEIGHVTVGQARCRSRSTRSAAAASRARSSTSTRSASTRRAISQTADERADQVFAMRDRPPRGQGRHCAPAWPRRSTIGEVTRSDGRRSRSTGVSPQVRRLRRARRRAPERARPGLVYGLLGPNGSRQVDADPHPVRPARADDGPRVGARPRRRRRTARRSAGDRLHEPEVRALSDDLTVVENLEFYARVYGLVGRAAARAPSMHALALTHIAPYANRRAGLLSRRLEAAARARRRADARAARSCSSTSRPPASIRSRGASCGTCCSRSPRRASRCSSRRTTWTRPSAARGRLPVPVASCSSPARPTELKELPEVNEPGTRRLELETRGRHDARSAGCARSRSAAARPCSGRRSTPRSTARSTDDDAARAARRRRASRATSRPIVPSLEDVFVALTERAAAERGQLAAVTA